MRTRTLLVAVLVSTGAASSSLAWADSVRVRDVPVEGVYHQIFSLRQGYSMFLSANGVSPDTETELDAFSYPGGQFIGRHLQGSETFVLIQALTGNVSFTVVVRGQPGTQEGDAILGITTFPTQGGANSSTQFTVHVAPVIAHTVVPGVLQAGAHVATVQQQDGPEDTVLLVYPAGSEANAPLQFDDDNGVGAMSWMHLQQSCAGPQGCGIVIGRRTNSLNHSHLIKQTIQPAGNATLVADDKIHVADSDQDGLSDELETTALSTNPNWPDTDFDGLLDGFEILGKDDAQHSLTSLTKFPLYGANPNVKDLFIEAHWQSPRDPNDPVCFVGLSGSGRPTNAMADQLAAIFARYGIATHLDNGIRRIGSTVSGDWGGGSLLLPWKRPLDNYCEGLSPARKSFFYNIITPSGNGQTGNQPCSLVPPDNASTAAHEIGHGFGLQHGGFAGSGHDNCKPNYQSMMNYALQGAGIFSAGTFLDRPLNPTSLDEATGLGTTDPAVLDRIQYNFGRLVDRATGGIDWDLDGIIAPPGVRVRGWLNYAPNSDCDMGAPARRANVHFLNSGPAALVDEGGQPVVLSVSTSSIGRVPASTLVRVGGNTAPCSGATTNVDTPCAVWGRSSSALLMNVALAPLAPAAVSGLTVVTDSQGHLAAVGTDSRGRPTLTRLAGPTIQGDPAAVEMDDVVSIYAPSQGVLRRWDFDRRYAVWVNQGSVVKYSTGDPLTTNSGVGATRGYETDVAGESLYLAVKAGTPVVTDPAHPTETARTFTDLARSIRTVLRPTINIFGASLPLPAQVTETWVKVPASFDDAGDQTNDGQAVSLAYVPFSGGPVSSGRFYLTTHDINGNPTIRITFGNRLPLTPGNDARAWKWLLPSQFANEWSQIHRSLHLAVIGGQLEAVAHTPNEGVSFFPNADGVYNHDQRDFNDVGWIHAHFACALGANTRCP